jgi:hypothetical protein
LILSYLFSIGGGIEIMMRFWVLCVGATLVTLPVQAGEFCGPQSAMGRWVPDLFSTPMNAQPAYFGRACAVHDACYQSRGADRAFCDAQFSQHLRYECDLAYPDVIDAPSKLACYAAASGFVASVRQFGNNYYERAQAQAPLFSWRP